MSFMEAELAPPDHNAFATWSGSHGRPHAMPHAPKYGDVLLWIGVRHHIWGPIAGFTWGRFGHNNYISRSKAFIKIIDAATGNGMGFAFYIGRTEQTHLSLSGLFLKRAV